MVRIALIGCGRIGTVHAAASAELFRRTRQSPATFSCRHTGYPAGNTGAEEHRMDHPGSLGEGGKERADDRDDVADRRDLISDQRDKAGDQRDSDAGDRDAEDSHQAHELTDVYRQLRRQILDHFAHIENSAVDPADWPDLPPAVLDQLDALVAQQRHRAARSRTAILTLLDELDAESHRNRTTPLESVATAGPLPTTAATRQRIALPPRTTATAPQPTGTKR